MAKDWRQPWFTNYTTTTAANTTTISLSGSASLAATPQPEPDDSTLAWLDKRVDEVRARAFA